MRRVGVLEQMQCVLSAKLLSCLCRPVSCIVASLIGQPHSRCLQPCGQSPKLSRVILQASLAISCHVHWIHVLASGCGVYCMQVLEFVLNAVKAEAFNEKKTLFLFGSYTIGKEKLFLEVARNLKQKVCCGCHFVY